MLSIDHVDLEILRKLVDSANRVGVDVDKLLKELHIGCTQEELCHTARISFPEYQRLQRRLSLAIRLAIHACVGKRAITPEETEVMFHYMIGADDLEGALSRMKFFTAMVGDRIGDGALRVDVGLPQIAKLYMRIGMPEEMQQAFAGHFMWEQLKVLDVLAWLIGQSIDIVKAELPFAPCPEVEQYLARLACPITYNATGYGFYFRKSLLKKPVVRTLAELKSYLRMFGALYVVEEHFERPPLKQRIERILEQQALDSRGMPSAVEVASALNMSEATMRRHLQECGSSFSAIKRDCQMRLGRKMLILPNYDVTSIAQQLGYQDVNAFRRAFRQTEGRTPEGYRRAVAAERTTIQ